MDGKLYQTGTANGDNPLYQWLSIVSFAPLLVLSIGACEGSQKDMGGSEVGQQGRANKAAGQPATKQGTKMTDQQAPINQRFRDLDEYLAHLERANGPMDKPWYKQVRPGIYELQTGNLRTLGDNGEEVAAKHTFTREELERKFGFK